ncbi:cytochrome b5, partial [Ramicandelaber brevisporus]
FPAPNGPQVAAPKVTPGAAALAPGRKKVALKPGFSPLDWARYKASGAPELRDEQPGAPPSSQRYGGMRRITMEELKQHGRNAASQWTAIGGKVYNITPYLDYHPGGRADLLKIAGKDGTKLFMYYHMWVNPDALLDTCFLGML